MPLSDTETKIVKTVVLRFMNLKESTKRKDLVTQFRSPQAVNRLINAGILKSLDNDTNVAPWAFGVECSEDSDSVKRAKSSLEIVLQALQNLYEVTPAGKQITRNEVLAEVNKMQGNTALEVVERGLYFTPELRVLDSYGPAPGPPRHAVFNIEWLVISENIVTVDLNNAWNDHIRSLRATLESTTSGPEIAAARSSQLSQDSDDRKFARMAVDEARKSVSEQDGRPRPKVGAVVVKNGQLICTAFRGEVLGNHAEYIALEKKLPDYALAGATIYTTLEPCTTRNHPKIPCVARLVQRKVARVVIGMLDPDTRITGKGQRQLRRANIITDLFPHDLMAEVEEMNREFTEFCEQQQTEIEQNPNRAKVSTNMMSHEMTVTATDDQKSQGRRWVEKTLAKLLGERGMRLDTPIQWTPDFDHGIYTLKASIAGTAKLWRLSYEGLEDCVADRNVQRAIEGSLRMYFVPDAQSRFDSRWKDSMSEEEIVEALRRAFDREQLDQPTLHILDRDGYISTSDVTNMQSTSPELLLISITPKGHILLSRYPEARS
jgi:pyrimidine deaminase RibD-like protein